MNDIALVARARGGDRDAFRALVEAYYDDLGRFARRYLGQREDAEDALQETFLRAYRSLGGYVEREAFRSWLFRILINRCRTLARRRTQRGRMVIGDEEILREQADARASTPSSDFEWRDALDFALSKLEPKLREAFLLKHGEGLEYSEIRSLTGASESALKMRVKRACEQMRPHLEAMWHE
jgi:RNA polymerase sigma-70 factor, ECF subfamily